VFWKALFEHNPKKLDLPKNSYSTANENLTTIKCTISHTNYYCKSTDPKILKPMGHTSYYIRVLLKIGNTSF
jgi:hypothetical protein